MIKRSATYEETHQKLRDELAGSAAPERPAAKSEPPLPRAAAPLRRASSRHFTRVMPPNYVSKEELERACRTNIEAAVASAIPVESNDVDVPYWIET